MKKGIFLLISIFFSGFLFLNSAYATCSLSETSVTDFLTECASDTNGVSVGTTEGKAGVRDIIQTISSKVIQIGAVFAIAFIVWAGMQYSLAYGDEEKIKHAKSTGIYAVIGLILLMAAYGLVDILVKFIYEVGN